MLFNYYNRKSIGHVQNETPQQSQEDQILQSFYQERRSRSTNVKHHNLLKKNISFFHQENEQQAQEQQQNLKYNTNTSNSLHSMQTQKKKLTTLNNQIEPQIKNIPPIPKPSLTKEYSNKSPLANHVINLDKNEKVQQFTKDYVKNDLNKRINIKNYLTEMQQGDKQNAIDKFNGQLDNQPFKKQSEVKLKYKYDSRVSEAQEGSLLGDYSRITNNIKDSRIHDSKHSGANLSQQSKNNNCYQISKNSKHNNSSKDQFQDIKYKFSEKSFSLKRNSLPTLGESRQYSVSSNSKLKRKDSHHQKTVLMAQEQLTYLDENSHPLRQTTQRYFQGQAITEKQPFFEPQKQFLYKQKIKDLQKQIQSLKNQHKREQKFIQSIYKMRRVMLSSQQDCSLKQLWRWIKELPCSSIVRK